MNEIIKDVQQNATLVIAVAITTALGTILLKKLFCGKKKRKYPRGSGPTGKGRWKLYHSKTLRSSRCLLLIEGLTKLKLISSVRILITRNEINPHFLGGLSLHLNHLIASCTANYHWPFGTLPFGLFWSNLDTRDLETYPRTYSGHF